MRDALFCPRPGVQATGGGRFPPLERNVDRALSSTAGRRLPLKTGWGTALAASAVCSPVFQSGRPNQIACTRSNSSRQHREFLGSLMPSRWTWREARAISMEPTNSAFHGVQNAVDSGGLTVVSDVS